MLRSLRHVDLDEQGGPVFLLAQAMRKHYISHDLPTHIPRRLAYALAGAPVKFVDVQLGDDGGRTSGTVVVFTAHLVAVVRIVGLSDSDVDAGDVSVSVVSRSALERLDLRQSSKPARNKNSSWQPNQHVDGWPLGGVVELVYRGLDHPVLVPSSMRSDREFEELLPGLLDDLRSGSVGGGSSDSGA